MTTRKDLIVALAKHADQPLTHATGLALVNELFPDRAHDPEKFGQKVYKGLVFRVESARQIINELHELHQLHWLETEKYRHGIPLNGNYEAGFEMERAGALIQFTAREESTGRLVGNIRMYVNESMQTQRTIASEDTFYLLPQFRKGLAAVRFWFFMEDCLKSIGVREIFTDTKIINKANKLSEYMGYTHIANRYHKHLGE